MSFTVLQLSPSTMESIYPKSPFLYGMGSAFSRDDALNLLKAGDAGYRVVAKFNVNTLNEVFDVSNSGMEEHLIDRIERMHSVSVGDIIVDDAESVWIVAPMGFDRLGNLTEIMCCA